MSTKPYRSYVLRLWEVETDGQPVWRASLQATHSGERLGFAGLEELNAFLRQVTAGSPAAPEAPGEADSRPLEPIRPEEQFGALGHDKDRGEP